MSARRSGGTNEMIRRMVLGGLLIFLMACPSLLGVALHGRLVKAVPESETGDGNIESTNNGEMVREYYPGGQLKSETPYASGSIHGAVVTYYENGNPMKREEYRAGVKDGASREFYEDGTLKNHETYQGNRQIGECYTNYPNGTRMMEGHCEDGKKTGRWTLFHQNGNKYMEGEYLDDERQGLWRIYSPEGWLDSEGEYLKGEQSGLWTYYDKAKRIVMKLTLKGGAVDGPAWLYRNGRLVGEGSMTGEAREPVKHGPWKAYHANGRVDHEGVYTMGKKNGSFREYYENGVLMAHGEYINDERSGEWVFYLKDGETVDPERSGSYLAGKLEAEKR